MKRALPFAFLIGLFAGYNTHACSGTQGHGGPSWQTVVQIGLDIAQAVAEVIMHDLESQPGLPDAVRASVTHAELIAHDSLALAQTTFTDYVHDQSVATQCRFRTYVDQAIGARTQIVVLITDAGGHVDPRIPANLGTLGSIADMFLPGCQGSSATARLRAALSPRTH